MKKRILSFIMACMMLAAVVVPAAAAEDVDSGTGFLPEGVVDYVDNILNGVKDFIRDTVDTAKDLIGKVSSLIGDADGDGIVSIFDATLIQRILVGLSECPVIKSVLDFDGDGEITIYDATAVQRFLVGLLPPIAPEEPAEEPTEEPSGDPEAFDLYAATKLGEVIAHNGEGAMTWNDTEAAYIITENEKIYRIKAALTPEIKENMDAVDFFAEDYHEQFNNAIGEALITGVLCISDNLPPQMLMDMQVGKTGQQLLDAGFEWISGELYPEDDQEYVVHCTMDYGYGRYFVTFSEGLDSESDYDEEETFKTLTACKIEFTDVSDFAYGIQND